MGSMYRLRFTSSLYNWLRYSAAYLRQTIMLSPFDTPEFRHLFNSELTNASGKGRLEGTYEPVQVPEGIAQVSYQG